MCRVTLLTASQRRSSGDPPNAVCVKRFRERNRRTFTIYGNYLTPTRTLTGRMQPHMPSASPIQSAAAHSFLLAIADVPHA